MVEGQPPHADGIQSGEEHPAVLRKVAEQRICTVTSEILFRIWVLKTEKGRYPYDIGLLKYGGAEEN